MVLRGFVDDSRTSDGPGKPNAFVLGGFLATADDWIQFSDEWEDTCNRDPQTPDWHMVEAFRIKGRYHWKDADQRDTRIRELVSVITKHAKYRVDAVVSAGNYDLIVRGKLPREIDDPYFLCYYTVVLGIADYLDKANIEGKVDWVFDEQGPLGVECVRWFEWVRQNVPENVRRRLGSSPIFQHDRDVLPLKAADVYAWQLRRYLAIEQPQGIPFNDNLNNLLAIRGISCYVRPEDLEVLVSSGGLTLRSKCVADRGMMES